MDGQTDGRTDGRTDDGITPTRTDEGHFYSPPLPMSGDKIVGIDYINFPQLFCSHDHEKNLSPKML